MIYSQTFRAIFMALMFTLIQISAQAQAAFWTESFASQNAFNAWTAGSTGAGAGVWHWTQNTGSAMGFSPPPPVFSAPTAANGFAFFDSDENGSGNLHDVTLTRGPINCAGHASVGIRFHSQFADYLGSTAQVRVSTNGGTSWTAYDIFDDQPSYGFDQGATVPADLLTDMALPAASGQNQVWIQFRWRGQWEYGWKLDDIELYDYVPGTANVKFRVNMALEQLNPGGAFLAGSFNNWTAEPMVNEGNGVWGLTKPLTEGVSYTYHFSNGPNTPEAVPAACGLDNDNGGFDRLYLPGLNDVELPVVCFGACTNCDLPCPINPNALFCDDFETYNIGNLSPQSPWWVPWTLDDASPASAAVSTAFASSGSKSMEVKKDIAGDDQLLLLGNKITGRYDLKWKMYIPAGQGAYFNIQTDAENPGASDDNYAVQVFFYPDGTFDCDVPLPVVSGTFPTGAWFDVGMIFDLDNNVARLFVNGTLARVWAYPQNLGALNFFAADGSVKFYVDEVGYIALPPLNVDICTEAVDLFYYFNGTPGVPRTTGIFDNTNAHLEPTDPEVTCWGDFPGSILDRSMWYTFLGDGYRYHIETVPCDATHYITGDGNEGDTQMLIYSGDNCNDLTEVVCNDDWSPIGIPDWRAGVDLQTDPGQTYFMLIDGLNLQSVVAEGEFCIEVTKLPNVSCENAAVGTYQVPNPYLCYGGQLSDLIDLNESSFVLTDEGEVNGMAWAVSTTPIPEGTWPAQVISYWNSSIFQDQPYALEYENLGPNPPPLNLPNTGFPYGAYYITPVVLGNGTLIDQDPEIGEIIDNVDVGGSCFLVGASTLVVFLSPITATAVPGNGVIDLTPAGGLGQYLQTDTVYTYHWSNGATTQDLSGIPAGAYTCTVSDISGCAANVVVTVTTVSTQSPGALTSFSVAPNPSAGLVAVHLELNSPSAVRLEVLNALGQTVRSLITDKVFSLQQPLDLNGLATGAYTLRVTVHGETAVQRLMLQR